MNVFAIKQKHTNLNPKRHLLGVHQLGPIYSWIKPASSWKEGSPSSRSSMGQNTLAVAVWLTGE